MQELGISKFPAIALMKHIVELKSNGFTAPSLEGSAGAEEGDDDALKKEKKKERSSLPSMRLNTNKIIYLLINLCILKPYNFINQTK